MADRKRIQKTEDQRHGWWDSSSNLGTEKAWAPDKNNLQSVLKMTTAGLPQTWAVALGIIGLNPVDRASVRGLIKFGAGGVTQEMEVDWLEGTVVNVVANAIEVVAMWDNVDALEASQTRLRASFGRYAATQRAQRTLISGAGPIGSTSFDITVNAGATATGIIIPKFTRQIRVYPGSLTSDVKLAAFYSPQLKVMTSGVQAGGSERGILTGTQLSQGVAVPMHAESRFFKVQNDTAEALIINAIADLF